MTDSNPSPARLPATLPVALAAALLCLPAAFAQTVTADLATVEVRGDAESDPPRAREAGGAKTEMPLQELPQAVRVITRDEIQALGARRLDDVLDFVSGVSRQNSVGGLSDTIAVRGLPGNEDTGLAMLLNGFPANRGYNAPRDLAGVERIEFLKGPAAALYGSSEPGGTLNIVSKRPLWTDTRSVELSAGNLGFRRAAVDLSGPVGRDFAYRLNMAVEKRDGFRDFVGSERQVLAPAFTWRISRDTALEYVGEYLRHAAPFDRGVVAVDNQLGAVPRSRFLGEPGDGDTTLRNQSHQFVLSHDWNADWRSRVAFAWRHTTRQGFSSDATALRADGLLTRQRRFRDYHSDDATVQAELIGKLRTGSLQHELLLGVEASDFHFDSLLLRVNPTASAPYAVDIYNPVYGQARPTPTANIDTLEKQRGRALYLQDAITLAPQWRLLAGVRIDDYEQSLLNRRSGSTTVGEPSSTSPRLGVSWLPTPQWTVYANAGRSFRPNIGSDANARAFDPETSRSLELGAKWESADQALGASAALFDIRKRNVLTADPLNAGFSATAGEIGSRGLELDLSGRLGTHWRLSGSAAFNDVEIRRDNNLEVGGRLLNAPRTQASALLSYQSAGDRGQPWGLGAGVVHIGKRLGQARTQAEAAAGTPAFDLPEYTTARLVGWWQLSRQLRLNLAVDNLFDKTYYTSSYSRVWVAPGTARALSLGLVAQF